MRKSAMHEITYFNIKKKHHIISWIFYGIKLMKYEEFNINLLCIVADVAFSLI